MQGEISFYSEDWACRVRWTENGGWEKLNFTESKWEKIGPPKITWK